ncbi:MAG: NAD(P)H-quinone oxidoreductase [Gammaproteobacteria bacterium]|nr:NAD(P)H-quinone oxidoreductase [Gammaproteobacteria bacterium]
MRAILVENGDLVWGEAEEPALGPGLVLIENHATAVNRADLAQRAGGYPPPPGASPILGLECAGVVKAVGEGVSRVKEGDEVCALLAGGGYAETVAVPAGQVLPKPAGLTFAEAASIPEVFATAYLNLFMEAGMVRGERAVLHAGASGVGTAAIQMCKAFGNPTFVTVGSDEKVARCVDLGADGGVNRHEGGFVDAVSEWTQGKGADVILDPVGGSYLVDNLASLNLDGRLVVIGLLGGSRAELPLGMMMTRRLRVIGSTLRARTIAAKALVLDALKDRVWPLIEEGTIKAVVEREFDVEDAGAAHELIASNETFGKIAMNVSPETADRPV